MKNTLQSALNVLAERTHDSRQNLKEKDRQRRNQVVDLFGIDLSRISNSDNEAVLYVSVSSDLVYYERFQFKIYIDDTTATDFQILARIRVEKEDDEYEWEDFDLTPYLQEQQDGDWITGESETAYPNNSDVVDSNPDEPPNAYDILDVASTLEAQGKQKIAEALLRPGFKKFIVKAESSFFAAMILYLKYSHLNR